MDKRINNFSYYLKEVYTLIKRDLSSNLLSILSLGFIFFILSLVVSVGISSQFLVDEIRSQAEISVYYYMDNDPMAIKLDLEGIPGVNSVNYISLDEANTRMKEVLGTETRILDLFDHNPFNPYLEVFIDLEYLNEVVASSKNITGVEVVRDNQEVLSKLEEILNIITVLGVFIFAAVSIATLVITAHIIRQGIYINKEAIGTLKLLGAPTYFIYTPFLLNGIFMTLLAGFASIGLIYLSNNYIYSKFTGVLPFIVLPEFKILMINLIIFNLLISILLGFLGSLLGIKTTKIQK